MPVSDLVFVIGARPNFMKVAPLLQALRHLQSPFRSRVVHTGQHYDANMSEVFLQQLGLVEIDAVLGVGSGPHGTQTARVLESFERYLLSFSAPPCGVVVVGDVNSTLACALAAAKLVIPVAHVEAGLRSGDRSMPEELNRIVTDALADLLFVSEPSGLDHLSREGIPQEKIFYVGNVMIDTLVSELPAALALDLPKNLGLETSPYALVTLHRPSNVDHPESLRRLVDFLQEVALRMPLAFPVHPRTRAKLCDENLLDTLVRHPQIRVLDPLGYRENLALMAAARLVLTDSGGIQEETTYLGVPCLTFRPNTERPCTTLHGSNTLVHQNFAHALRLVDDILAGRYKKSRRIQGWDGQAARRIVTILTNAWGTEKHDATSVSEVQTVPC